MVLGDIFYLIRFPTMDLDELIQSVSRTKILTTEEALNLILMVKHSKPRQKLCFSNRKRQGVWETRLYKGLQFDYPQLSTRQTHVQVPFVVQNCSQGILIKSIYLLNVHSCHFEKITLKSTQHMFAHLKTSFTKAKYCMKLFLIVLYLCSEMCIP